MISFLFIVSLFQPRCLFNSTSQPATSLLVVHMPLVSSPLSILVHVSPSLFLLRPSCLPAQTFVSPLPLSLVIPSFFLIERSWRERSYKTFFFFCSPLAFPIWLTFFALFLVIKSNKPPAPPFNSFPKKECAVYSTQLACLFFTTLTVTKSSGGGPW